MPISAAPRKPFQKKRPEAPQLSTDIEDSWREAPASTDIEDSWREVPACSIPAENPDHT